jgi:hypothetical protein
VTQFPELQDALVEAAGRYHTPRRRTWRAVRLAVPAVAVALAAALAILVALPRSSPDTEKPAPGATRADAFERQFSVFRRLRTAADAIPASFHISAIPLQRDRGRLLGRDGDLRLFLVPTTRGGVCPLAFVGGRFHAGTCVSLAEATDAPMGDYGRGGTVAWVLGDELADMRLSLVDGSVLHTRISGNAVILRPGAPALSISWADASGQRHGMLVEQRICPPLDPLPADAQQRASVVAQAAARDLFGATDPQVVRVGAAPRNAGDCGAKTALRALLVNLRMDGPNASRPRAQLLVGQVDGAVTVYQQLH